jgi:hypothetical protein
MRTAGILLGSLLMLALFMLVLVSGNYPPAVGPGADDEAPSLSGAGGPAASVDVPVEEGGDSAEVPATAAAGPEGEPRLAGEGAGLVLRPEAWNQAIVGDETARDNDAGKLSRYRVWTPFRSQWAAEGFARRLTLATDVPVEVVNTAPGNYQVVFRYRNEGERQTRVRQIETVTGLELELELE